jgi:hypothetical protein
MKTNKIKKMDKVQVLLEKDVVEAMIKLKGVGDTYSDIIRSLLKNE